MYMALCKSCGNEVNGGKFCGKCGASLEEVTMDAPVAPVPAMSDVPGQVTPATTLPSDGMGIAGFVCGLIGFLCCTYIAIPGLICSIISMQNVKQGKVDPKNKWMGIVGLVFSILGIVMLIINCIRLFG